MTLSILNWITILTVRLNSYTEQEVSFYAPLHTYGIYKYIKNCTARTKEWMAKAAQDFLHLFWIWLQKRNYVIILKRTLHLATANRPSSGMRIMIVLNSTATHTHDMKRYIQTKGICKIASRSHSLWIALWIAPLFRILDNSLHSLVPSSIRLIWIRSNWNRENEWVK